MACDIGTLKQFKKYITINIDCSNVYTNMLKTTTTVHVDGRVWSEVLALEIFIFQRVNMVEMDTESSTAGVLAQMMLWFLMQI